MTPRKKEENNSFNIQQLMQGSDSYKSLIYGIVTVVVLFIVIALGINTLSKNKPTIDEKAAMTNTDAEKADNKYTVLEGETLWSIAQKHYSDGYKWVEIAKANNLSNPSAIEKGSKLIIPTISPTQVMAQASQVPTNQPTPTLQPSPTVMPTATTVPVTPTGTMKISPTVTISQAPKQQIQQPMNTAGSKITGNSYTVVQGDNLWTIAVRAYNDGYKWVEIAKANKLINPNVIHVGNKFVLPR